LAPGISKTQFSKDEDLCLMNCVQLYGTKWKGISKFFPGRTGDCLKNRYHSLCKSKGKEKALVVNGQDSEVTKDLAYEAFYREDFEELKKLSDSLFW
ncbi:MAG: SANT/Myb domain-containing protein, partial [Holosporaceae bacterium]|nr:SANT/Myb domain-containing protein [Holosporaceae bacterium]